jgi:lysyl-tRNA synthetase, class II
VEEESKETKLYLDEVTGEQVSKTELKKRQKKRENDAKLAEKKRIQAEKDAANPKKEKVGQVEEELDPTKYTDNRKNWIQS